MFLLIVIISSSISIIIIIFYMFCFAIISHFHCFVMSRYHCYYCFHRHLYQFFNSLFLFTFFFIIIIIIIILVLFFSFYFWLNNSFFSDETVKVSRLFCLLVSLFCFLSWNYGVIIHSFITFLPFPKVLQFSSFISVLT